MKNVLNIMLTLIVLVLDVDVQLKCADTWVNLHMCPVLQDTSSRFTILEESREFSYRMEKGDEVIFTDRCLLAKSTSGRDSQVEEVGLHLYWSIADKAHNLPSDIPIIISDEHTSISLLHIVDDTSQTQTRRNLEAQKAHACNELARKQKERNEVRASIKKHEDEFHRQVCMVPWFMHACM